MAKVYNNFVGIDIGKTEFVVNIHGSKKTYSYPNTIEGLSEFYQAHKKVLSDSLIVLEVTGGYERLTINYLQNKGLAVHRASGRRVKNFIRSLDIIGKSDQIDATALALYASERHSTLPLYEPSKYDLLRELSGRRSDLVKMRTQEKNRSQAPGSQVLSETYAKMIEVLNEQISAIEAQISQFIASDPDLQRKYDILLTVPGIGPVTAGTLLSQMPEIGTMNQKQVASLAGVAPHPNQSGSRIGYRRTRGGRREIRSTLYVGAMAASKGKTELGLFYKKLIGRGKAPRCAFMAVMRKMVVIGNARIRDDFKNNGLAFIH